MSDIRDRIDALTADPDSRAAYDHEIALSAYTNRIARLMKDQNVSQSELARRLGVSRARVSQLMQHRSSPTLRTMVEVAAALGCDISADVVPRSDASARLVVAEPRARYGSDVSDAG